MRETDAIWMAVVVFLPALFGLGLALVPARARESVRWWTLFGTSLTLGAALAMFLQFRYDTLEATGALFDRDHRRETTLAQRVLRAQTAPAPAPEDSADWVARIPWIGQLNIDFALGLDGASMALALLTTIVCWLASMGVWAIDRLLRGYCLLLLLLETTLLGTFLAIDLFLLYAFLQATLLPIYFLVAVWGGTRREAAALKLVVFGLVAGTLILVALLGFYFTDVRDFVPAPVGGDGTRPQPVHTLDAAVLQRAGHAAYLQLTGQPVESLETTDARRQIQTGRATFDDRAVADGMARLDEAAARLGQPFFTAPYQLAFFVLLAVGFGMHLAVVPLHTWLAEAQAEATTPVGMILIGPILAVGGYGLLRVALCVCPWAAQQAAWYLALLGVVTVLYGAFAALGQVDLKKLVACVAVSGAGHVLLGLAAGGAVAVNGAVFLLVANGLTAAGLVFIAGAIDSRFNHRRLDRLGGLSGPMPVCGGMAGVLFFAAMGLPGLAGFVGPAMVLLGVWSFDPLFAVLGAAGLVVLGGTLVWTYQRVFFGPGLALKGTTDLDWRELATVVPLVVLAIVLGLAPALVLNWTEPSVTGLVEMLPRTP